MEARNTHVQRYQGRNHTPVGRKRCYLEPQNAAGGVTKLMMREGRVGEVAEVYHVITGLQIGTVKITASGRLITNFIWDEKNE